MKYILEYENFLNEGLDNNLSNYIKNNFDYKISLSKYGLLQLKTFRINGYKKVLSELQSIKLKESLDNSAIFENFRLLDDEYDRFFYIISEFRKTILEYESKNLENNYKNNKPLKFLSDSELIDHLKIVFDGYDMKYVVFDLTKHPKGNERFKVGGEYTFNANNDIIIYFNNFFDNTTFHKFIFSDEKTFHKMLNKLSITFYHETVHYLQHKLNPNLMLSDYRKHVKNTNAMINLNKMNIDQQYYSNEYEIDACAHETVKQLHYNDKLSYDDILNIINNPDKYSEKVHFINVYKYLFKDYNKNIYDKFLTVMKDIVNKRIENNNLINR